MIITGYKDILSIDEGFDSGFVFPSAAYNVTKGDIVVVVANDEINNKIKGYVIEYSYKAPSYIGQRVFTRKEKRSEYEVFVGTPIKKFEISDTQFGLYQGGKVGVKDGSQEKIKNYLKRV